MREYRDSGALADDHSSTFLAQHTPFLGLRAVIAALFALQEAKHAVGALTFASSHSVGINGQRRILAGEVRPAAAAIKSNLNASGGTCDPVSI